MTMWWRGRPVQKSLRKVPFLVFFRPITGWGVKYRLTEKSINQPVLVIFHDETRVPFFNHRPVCFRHSPIVAFCMFRCESLDVPIKVHCRNTAPKILWWRDTLSKFSKSIKLYSGGGPWYLQRFRHFPPQTANLSNPTFEDVLVMSSGVLQIPDRHTFLPGFIPGSLYVVILERREIPSASLPSSSISGGASGLEYLGLFYQEKPTIYPFSSEEVLSGHYWGLLAPNHTTGGHMSPITLSIPIVQALGVSRGEISMEDVLGYVRIAERVDIRALRCYLGYDGTKIDPEMTSETYAFNALSVLRRAGVIRSMYWNREAFDVEMAYFRRLWSTERAVWVVEARREALEELRKKKRRGRAPPVLLPEQPRRKEFAEVWWGDFSMQEHYRRR